MHMRYQCKVGAISGLQEESHTSEETDKGRAVVSHTNRNLECTREERETVNPHLLGPDGMCASVNEISDEATGGTEDNVHQTEHCCPIAAASLSKLWEVLEIVRAEDGVDGQLS